jgi:L-rhamnose isomerase/sugar isomerase
MADDERILMALNQFSIELPSWGFANTGTRFGKFFDPAAASTIEEKIHDAGQVNNLTGCCPTIAIHVLWDCPEIDGAQSLDDLAIEAGIRIGSINPNLFQDQKYKFGSLANPDPRVREAAIEHCIESVKLSSLTQSRDISLWLADGSNFPGTAHIRNRRSWLKEGLRRIHDQLSPEQRLLIEYKPFEPAFYHTDIADWGMAYLLAGDAGPQACVLVDTGHHYQGQNIEQIVAWLLQEDRLGGFHFNDRRYADDDLTLGSIDPYQVFRIFHEILLFEWEARKPADIAFMIDQSHNLKPKLEAMVQTVVTAQELYLKAACVDYERLHSYQLEGDLVGSEECLKDGFRRDVTAQLQSWRAERGLPLDPLKALREGEYLKKIRKQREGRKPEGQSYA